MPLTGTSAVVNGRHTVSSRTAAALLGLTEDEVIRRCKAEPGAGWRLRTNWVVAAAAVQRWRHG